jgi:hypothetical protein
MQESRLKQNFEIYHASKVATGDDSLDGDMKNMKAKGKL